MLDDRTAPTREASIAAPRPVDAALPMFAAIGRYKILGLLGRGGMGDVYLGLDEQLERQVAIKLLSRRLDPSTVSDRLQREALALARLAHPNVVAIHEVGESAGQVYLAMERIAGVTLRTWLAEEKRGRDEILAVMLQAGRGLAAAHAAGLVHRDFKPESRRPSQTAPQPTDRPHSHSQGRFERVDVYPTAPGCSGVAQVLAKRWQRPGPPEDGRGPAHRAPQPA